MRRLNLSTLCCRHIAELAHAIACILAIRRGPIDLMAVKARHIAFASAGDRSRQHWLQLRNRRSFLEQLAWPWRAVLAERNRQSRDR